MALVGVELETLVFEPDALTTRPPPCARKKSFVFLILEEKIVSNFLNDAFDNLVGSSNSIPLLY